MRTLATREPGEITATAQYKDSAGRWVTAPRLQKATGRKARVYVRGEDGQRKEIVRFARTRRAGLLDRNPRSFGGSAGGDHRCLLLG